MQRFPNKRRVYVYAPVYHLCYDAVTALALIVDKTIGGIV